MLWYRFALLGVEDSLAQPRPELRRKVLESVAATELHQRPTIRWPTPYAAAAAAVLVTVSAFSWYLGRQGFLRQSHPPSIVVTRPVPAQSQDEVRGLRERLEKAEQALAARGKSATAEYPATRPQPEPMLESALVEARRALADARQELAEQRTRTAALEGELQTQRNLLATAVRERQAAENRAVSLTEDRSKADEREAQIRTLTFRIQQLEHENAEYRTIMDRQQTNVERSLKLAGLLNTPSLRMARLQSTEKGAASVGYAFVEGSRVLFYASRLPDLPTGRTYQLWLIRGRAPAIVSGGVFTAGRQQRAMVEFTDPQLASNITALAVTEEPASGSSLPTGHKILIGSLPAS